LDGCPFSLFGELLFGTLSLHFVLLAGPVVSVVLFALNLRILTSAQLIALYLKLTTLSPAQMAGNMSAAT